MHNIKNDLFCCVIMVSLILWLRELLERPDKPWLFPCGAILGMSKWKENLAQTHNTAYPILPQNTQGSHRTSRSQPLGSRMSGLPCWARWYLLLETTKIFNVQRGLAEMFRCWMNQVRIEISGQRYIIWHFSPSVRHLVLAFHIGSLCVCWYCFMHLFLIHIQQGLRNTLSTVSIREPSQWAVIGLKWWRLEDREK